MRAEDERTYADYVGARTGALRDYAYLPTGDPDAARNAVLRALTAAHADWHRAERDGPDAHVYTSCAMSWLRRRLARRRCARARGRRGVVRPRSAATAVTSNPRAAVRRAAHRRGDRTSLAMTPAAVRAQSAKAIATLARSTGNCGGARRSKPNRAVSSPTRWHGFERRFVAVAGGRGCRWCRRPRRRWRRLGLRPQQPRAAAEPRRSLQPPPADSDCTWTPRVDLGTDTEFVAAAMSVWQSAPDGRWTRCTWSGRA